MSAARLSVPLAPIGKACTAGDPRKPCRERLCVERRPKCFQAGDSCVYSSDNYSSATVQSQVEGWQGREMFQSDLHPTLLQCSLYEMVEPIGSVGLCWKLKIHSLVPVTFIQTACITTCQVWSRPLSCTQACDRVKPIDQHLS